jgi:uncharacterized protein YecT (DUF1311 family)
MRPFGVFGAAETKDKGMHPLLIAAALAGPPASPDYSFKIETPASEARLSQTFKQCRDRDYAFNQAHLRCIGPEWARQDERLNKTYRLVMSRLAPRERVRLRNLQRAWIPRHEATCAGVSGVPYTGTDGDVFEASCLLHEVIKRTIWLERYPRRILRRRD